MNHGTYIRVSSKDETVKTTWNSSNITIPSLNEVFYPFGIQITYFIFWEKKEEVYSCRVGGNHMGAYNSETPFIIHVKFVKCPVLGRL